MYEDVTISKHTNRIVRLLNTLRVPRNLTEEDLNMKMLHELHEAEREERRMNRSICNFEREQSNRTYWQNHREDNPDCDCIRCQTYRGEFDKEDTLGW